MPDDAPQDKRRSLSRPLMGLMFASRCRDINVDTVSRFPVINRGWTPGTSLGRPRFLEVIQLFRPGDAAAINLTWIERFRNVRLSVCKGVQLSGIHVKITRYEEYFWETLVTVKVDECTGVISFVIEIGSGGLKGKGPGGKRSGAPCIHNRNTNEFTHVRCENYGKQKIYSVWIKL